MKKILVLSSCVDNMSPQLGFESGDILEGNYKDIPGQIQVIESGRIKGIIIDGNLPHEDLYKIVGELRQAGFVHKETFPFIILGARKYYNETKTVLKIEDLIEEFKLAA